jgi:histidine triad (HIT) family protein
MSTTQPNCPFCDIIGGLSPADTVREWDDAIAIVPLNPVTSGHTLVIPKTHVQSFFSSPDVSAATMRRAAEMLHGVERHHDPRDYNVITSAGPAATQTVMHLHVHLIPRQRGDGLALPWDVPQPELLTPLEWDALRLSGQLGGMLREIVGGGPNAKHDWAEAANRVHEVQHTILRQAAARAYPDDVRLLGRTLPLD